MKRSIIVILLIAMMVNMYGIAESNICEKLDTNTNIRINDGESTLETKNIVLGEKEIAYFPLIAIMTELGVSCQRQEGICVFLHGEKEFVLEMEKYNITLYAIDTPNVNMLMLPPGSYGAPFYCQDDIYINLATLSHVFRKMGIKTLISVDDYNIYCFHTVE